MNTYKKYCPNVYVAKCPEQHSRGEEIVVTTRYGKENECVVHNLVGRTRDGDYLYSITRTDGFDSRERAKRKAERLNTAADNANKKSTERWEASREGADFLALGEPIKVGHHSEKRHRALIQRNHDRMAKSVEYADKADSYASRAEYWENRTDIIDLSMPESIDYFAHKLEEAQRIHAGMKDGSIERAHSYSLTYAKKDVNKFKKSLELAEKLWGTEE